MCWEVAAWTNLFLLNEAKLLDVELLLCASAMRRNMNTRLETQKRPCIHTKSNMDQCQALALEEIEIVRTVVEG